MPKRLGSEVIKWFIFFHLSYNQRYFQFTEPDNSLDEFITTESIIQASEAVRIAEENYYRSLKELHKSLEETKETMKIVELLEKQVKAGSKDTKDISIKYNFKN